MTRRWQFGWRPDTTTKPSVHAARRIWGDGKRGTGWIQTRLFRLLFSHLSEQREPFSAPQHSQLHLMKSPIALLFLCLVVFAAGCQGPRTSPPIEPEVAKIGNTLEAGDVLRISFAGTPDLNQSQKIRPDGRVTLPLLGEVEVAGKTPMAVQGELRHRYKAELQNNEITVGLESSAFPVYVSGAVNKAGKIALDRPLTVLEVIMEAGGFTRGLADPSKVRIIRKVNGKHQTTVLDLRPAMQGQPATAVYVQRYDVIVVPETWL